jgi:integrase
MLATLIGHHKEGFLFRTSTGRPLSARNVLRDSLHLTLLALKQPKMGFHCFRRFRESVLQKSEARALLIDYWMGHENQDMGTRYRQQLLKDAEWRKEWAEKIGVGLKLTSLELRIAQPGQLSKSKTRPCESGIND